MLELLKEGDWEEAFGYGGKDKNTCATTCQGFDELPQPVEGCTSPCHGFDREDVAEIVFSREGEHDEMEWMIAGRLHDGRWFYLEAGCDYTGWD